MPDKENQSMGPSAKERGELPDDLMRAHVSNEKALEDDLKRREEEPVQQHLERPPRRLRPRGQPT